jgi:hypothetical protein
MRAGLVLCTVCWCCHGCEHAQLSDQVSASVMAVNLCAWGVCVCAALSSKQWRLAPFRAAAVVCFAVWGCGVRQWSCWWNLLSSLCTCRGCWLQAHLAVRTAVSPSGVSIAGLPVGVISYACKGAVAGGLACFGPTKIQKIKMTAREACAR